MYESSGKLPIAGFFFPVNESIWEHLKLAFYPILIVWIFPQNFTWKAALCGAGNSTITCMLIILTGYYTLKYGFSVEGLAIDLILLFIGILFGQTVGFQQAIHNGKATGILWGFYLILIAGVFILFTQFPPNLPVFQPPI